MSSTLHLRLSDAEKTRFAGYSLAETLYDIPVTLLLTGDLGAGKTTFLQGFADNLGISEHLTSPTYALEQRYETNREIPFIHLDLYRLKERDAEILVDSTDDHTGIRCIEWANRLPASVIPNDAMQIHLTEDGNGRMLSMTFDDETLPSEKQIDDWRAEAMLPPHITRHCETVARVAQQLSSALMENGHIIRQDALVAAARLHDLLRFIDFKGLPPAGMTQTEEERRTWEYWSAKFSGKGHEHACSDFMRQEGFPVISRIIETHGLRSSMQPMQTIEQKILFYADKRCIDDTVVTLEERFDDFRIRYANGKETEEQKTWEHYTKNIEEELFPNGVPLSIS